jgi:hypothetical protein
MTPAEPLIGPGALSGAPNVEALLKRGWARWLLPSFSDFFFLAILAWLFASGGGQGWAGLLADGDAGWHIRTGEYILDHRAVPYQDLYSFSKPGAEWFAWEWLADVIAAGLHRMAGLKGVVLFTALVLGVFATTLVRRMMAQGAHLFVAMGVALLGIGCSSVHYLARPHIYTLLLMSVAMWVLEADRVRKTRRLWWLIPMTAVWTNLHGGFLAWVAVAGLTTVGTMVEVHLGAGRTLRDVARYGALTVGCALASLANPYGWRLHQHVGEYLDSGWIRNVIQEFQSPSFRGEAMLQFEVLLFAGLLVAAMLIRRQRIVEALWIAAWAHLALGSVRHVPLFVAACAPVIATELSAWWTRASAGAKQSSLTGILNALAADSTPGFRRTSLWPLAVAVALAVAGEAARWPQDFPEQLFPVAMIRAHAAELKQGRVLTTDQWADYLIYRDPLQKVFVDGRSDFYGETIGNRYIQVINGAWQWRQWMEEYKFDVALLPTSVALAALLKEEPGWRTVADDGKHVLLTRRP